MPIAFEVEKYSPQTFEVGNYHIVVEGPDAIQYIHSQTTNNVKELKLGTYQFNSLLDSTGKIISAFILVKESESKLTIILKEENLQDTLSRLEKYHISEDLEMTTNKMRSYLHLNQKIENSYYGQYFFEGDLISFSDKELTKTKTGEEILRVLTGVLDFNLEREKGKLINNTVYDEIGIDYKKGCFPGQETVSKINTRKGAAYKPMLLTINSSHDLEDLVTIRDGSRKIGTVLTSFTLEDKTFIVAELLREYRINKKQFEVLINEKPLEVNVTSLPSIPVSNKERVEELYDYAVELFQKSQEKSAVEYFLKCIEMDPLFEDAYESLGVLYGRLERFDLAIEMMEKLKEINPKCMMAFTNLSLYHMKIGEIEKAEDYKSQATLLNFQILGDEAERKRKQEEVENLKKQESKRREGMFAQVLEMDPEDAMANNGMGEILLEKGEFEKATSHFKQAIETDMKYSVAYLGLAKCLYQLRKSEEFVEILEKGIAIASKNGELMPANEMQSMLSKTR